MDIGRRPLLVAIAPLPFRVPGHYCGRLEISHKSPWKLNPTKSHKTLQKGCSAPKKVLNRTTIFDREAMPSTSKTSQSLLRNASHGPETGEEQKSYFRLSLKALRKSWDPNRAKSSFDRQLPLLILHPRPRPPSPPARPPADQAAAALESLCHDAPSHTNLNSESKM